MSTKIITPVATLSYPHLHQPQASENGGKPKYSCALIFAPGADLTALRDAINAAAEAKFPGKGADMVRKGQLKTVLRSGQEKDYAEGSFFLNARTEQKPGIVYAWKGEDGKPARVRDEDVREQMYPGAQVRASLTAFYYEKGGNKGIGFALNNLQKIAEGERIDGRKAAEDEFEADLSATPVDLSSLA